jgi:hypothetical protein
MYSTTPAGANDGGAVKAAHSHMAAPREVATSNAATSCGSRIWSQCHQHRNDPSTGNNSRFPVTHFHNSLPFLTVFTGIKAPSSAATPIQRGKKWNSHLRINNANRTGKVAIPHAVYGYEKPAPRFIGG